MYKSPGDEAIGFLQKSVNRKRKDMLVLKVFLLSVAIMALVLVGLALQIIMKKGGKFPNTHIGSNKYMKENGVTCAQTYDKIEQAKVRKELRFKQLSVDDSDVKYFC